MHNLSENNIKQTRNADVYSKFGTRMEFDLRKGFPILTTKRVPWKTVLRELLWFISGSTDNRILKDKKLADAYSSLQKIHDTYARVIGNDAIQIRQRLEKSMMADLKRKVKNWDDIYSAL